MKTKAEIVQRLLEEKKIDAEEAVVLLMSEDKQLGITFPVWPATQPVYPYNPNPYYPNGWPIVTYCNTSDPNRTFLY